MDVLRYMFTNVKNTEDLQYGDRIVIDKYTATCQKVNDGIAVFCMDQYLDETMPMDPRGYETSDLRKRINSEEVLSLFPEEIRFNMIPFENGDLVRIPYAEEMFDLEEIIGVIEDYFTEEQWFLMKDRRNRICLRVNHYEWGWLVNRAYEGDISYIDSIGDFDYGKYYDHNGVRLVFQLSLAQDTSTIIGGDIYENNETIDSKSDGHGKTGTVDCW